MIKTAMKIAVYGDSTRCRRSLAGGSVPIRDSFYEDCSGAASASGFLASRETVAYRARASLSTFLKGRVVTFGETLRPAHRARTDGV